MVIHSFKLDVCGWDCDLGEGLLSLLDHGSYSNQGKQQDQPMYEVSGKPAKNCARGFRPSDIEWAVDHTKLVGALKVAPNIVAYLLAIALIIFLSGWVARSCSKSSQSSHNLNLIYNKI